MFAIPKSDPLDVLVFGIGLRLTQLAKMGDPKFKKLLENRNFTIQMGSEAQDLYRTFKVENGRFSQTSGKTDKPTLSIDFKDSMTGAKLLTKGDAAAFMVGVQSGDVKMSGDYSLLMWFNQVAKYIVPKVPEQLQPAVEMAKPFITKATPVAKDLCEKAMSLLAGLGILGGEDNKASDKKSAEKTENKDDSEKKSKYFSETSDVKKDEKSLVDTAKEKLADVKAEVEEKVGELKDKAEEKLAEVKHKTEDLTKEAKEKIETVKSDATEKLDTVKDKADELKSEAETKVADIKTEVKDKTEDLSKEAKDKLAEVKSETTDKLADAKTDVKDSVKDTMADVKTVSKDTADTVKDKADDFKTEVKEKLNEIKADVKPTVGSQSQTNQNQLQSGQSQSAGNITTLSPALQKTHELEEKHAGEKVIAENVKIDAVKDDKSPVTEVMVTRASDKK